LKKLILWAVLMCALVIGEVKYATAERMPINFVLDESYLLNTIYHEPKRYGQMEKQLYKAAVKKDEKHVADLYMQTARFENGDVYYIIRMIGQQPKGVTAPWTVDLSSHIEEPDSLRYLKKTDDSLTIEGMALVEQEYSPTGLPKQAYFIEEEGTLEHPSAYFSMVEVYRLGQKSTLIAEKKKSHNVMFTNGKLTFQFETGKDMVTEHWGILSQKPLVNWDNPEAIEAIQLASKYKWTMGGMYYSMPSSYQPYHKDGYYYNPAQHVGESYLRKTDLGRFFEVFALVSLYNSIEMQNSHGFWWITTQSDWLYGSYGIPSMYYDTRWSTDAAMFLVRGFNKYKDPAFLRSSQIYADFFANFARENNYRTANQGILVEDYWHPHVDPLVHSSLNHHLSEINFLLELYQVAEDQTYYELAMQMKQGVADIAKAYVKPNGDLWYAYMPNGTYGYLDYPLLTLLDLQRTQELLLQVTMIPDPDIQYLIETKLAFLKKSGFVK
jgi:hypothetical protein